MGKMLHTTEKMKWSPDCIDTMVRYWLHQEEHALEEINASMLREFFETFTENHSDSELEFYYKEARGSITDAEEEAQVKAAVETLQSELCTDPADRSEATKGLAWTSWDSTPETWNGLCQEHRIEYGLHDSEYAETPYTLRLPPLPDDEDFNEIYEAYQEYRKKSSKVATDKMMPFKHESLEELHPMMAGFVEEYLDNGGDDYDSFTVWVEETNSNLFIDVAYPLPEFFSFNPDKYPSHGYLVVKEGGAQNKSEAAIAMSGAGMDLTEQLVKAFIEVEYVPPLVLARSIVSSQSFPMDSTPQDWQPMYDICRAVLESVVSNLQRDLKWGDELEKKRAARLT